MRQYRDKEKVIRVIESCQNMEQLQVASNMATMYEKIYGIDSDLFNAWLQRKFELI